MREHWSRSTKLGTREAMGRFITRLATPYIHASSYVTQTCVTHTHHTLQVSNKPTTNSVKASRSKGWTKLTVGELLVWIGITMKMGTLGRPRAFHYWSTELDFANEVIRSSMKFDRYIAITANLCFAPRGTPSGWPKIKWLDDVLRAACRAATGITQHLTIVESMIKCLSKYCPWIQFMPKKPIKRGTLL